MQPVRPGGTISVEVEAHSTTITVNLSKDSANNSSVDNIFNDIESSVRELLGVPEKKEHSPPKRTNSRQKLSRTLSRQSFNSIDSDQIEDALMLIGKPYFQLF